MMLKLFVTVSNGLLLLQMVEGTTVAGATLESHPEMMPRSFSLSEHQWPQPGGGEVFSENLGGSMRPASQNPYPIYD